MHQTNSVGEDSLNSLTQIRQGLDYLGSLDPVLKVIIDQVGEVPLRKREGGFDALVGMIVSQQISVAAANSILNRLKNHGLTEAKNVIRAQDKQLKACGLSPQKISYIRNLAQAGIDFDELHKQSSQEVINQLTAVKGIGLWTAEIYLMFSMGRKDVFAAGDLALQEATKVLLGLDKRPTEKELRAIAIKWSPWQSVAARLLWAYYRMVKKREGIR